MRNNLIQILCDHYRRQILHREYLTQISATYFSVFHKLLENVKIMNLSEILLMNLSWKKRATVHVAMTSWQQ